MWKCKCGNTRFRGRKIKNVCRAVARSSCVASCTKCGRNVTIDAEALYSEGKLQLVRITMVSRPSGSTGTLARRGTWVANWQ